MVKISDLFDVQRGTCGKLDGYASGTTLLVTATTYNHAAGGFVTPKEDDRTFEPMSVAVAIDGDGSVMFGSVQRTRFVASTHVEVLTPKTSPFWESAKLEKLIAIASMLRTQRWRFGFGRSAAGRLKSLELDELLLERIAGQVQTAKPAPVAFDPSGLNQVVAKLFKLYGEEPTIEEVFELKQNKPFGMEFVKEQGTIPVTSATEKEVNSVVGYVDAADELMPANTISVTKDGKPGVARVQPRPWVSASNSVCLNPNAAWSQNDLILLAAMIERQCWRFGYGRKASVDRLSELKLLDGLHFSGAPHEAALHPTIERCRA